jgi:D-ribose pyranose/furanose isomerase RbsD
MKKLTRFFRYVVVPAFVAIVVVQFTPLMDTSEAGERGTLNWREMVARELPVLGHRNWIVVADSAYPAQSRAGIVTIYVGGQQLAAVQETLRMIDEAKHVQAVAYIDEELASVPEEDAPGVVRYRKQLDSLLKGRTVKPEPHEQIIAKLDEVAKTFRVLIIKTDCTLPYTSVFIELDCGYWGPEQEQRLRARIGQ